MNLSDAPPPTRLRLAIVASHPIQYYAPWFRELAANEHLQVKVFYLHDPSRHDHADAGFGRAVKWDLNLLDGYDHEFVPNASPAPSPDTFKGLDNPSLSTRMDVFAPQALLVYGYAFKTHLRLIVRRFLRLERRPLIFRGDSHLMGGPPPPWRKRWLLRFLYGRFSAFLPVGQANREYFAHFGVPAEKMFTAPHCVNAAHFMSTSERVATAQAERKRLGIPEDHRVVLFSGKFSPKKRPDLLLRAFARSHHPKLQLVLAGNGELEDDLRRAAADTPQVHFLPFANQQAMPARYLLGDVYALPSSGRYETWGLAVNEAMHLGRPALVSTVVGCQRDLVEPGQTGWVFPADDEDALVDTLRQIGEMETSSFLEYGRCARARMADFTYASATAGLMRALAALKLS